MRGNASRYFHTLRYLKPEQIVFQLYYRLRRLVWSYPLESKKLSEPLVVEPLVLIPSVSKPSSYLGGVYTFLNLEKDFSLDRIDWECTDYGKLWLYNLHYFDYLLQPDLDKQIGLQLIRQYVEALPGMKVGIEPYPTSLRGINWIKFQSLHGIRDEAIDRSLYSQYHLLSRSLEYHLLGNHLLENAFSLLFGACYFREQKWYDKSHQLLLRELDEQILDDGAHFELSPMYHRILLDRLLDCINLLQNNTCFKQQAELLHLLAEKAGKMFCWLDLMTFSNGRTPHLNDATDGIAPVTAELCTYAERLGLHAVANAYAQLSDSGYRRFDGRLYECIVDVGQIGPDYIPGHAHADTFNFVLNMDGEPLIVGTGISTYEKNEIRQRECSTNAHNTVVVNGRNSSDVWGGFRVGKRAKTVIEESGKNLLCARHDGYRDQGVTHRRTWVFSGEEIEITEEVVGASQSAEAFLHFDCRVEVIDTDGALVADGVRIEFHGAEQVELADYEQALGFNKRQGSRCARIEFRDRLVTKIRM